ncbi:unnamed protein product [Chrysoparadoxa australica]
MEALPPTESSPLIGGGRSTKASLARRVHLALEGTGVWGARVEAIMIGAIVINVVCFLLSTDSSFDGWTAFFDAVEIITVALFTVEYILRLCFITETTDKGRRLIYHGCSGRLVWAVTDFYSLVDLASILPFYIDLFIPQDLPASQFIRLLRLFRVMRVEGRYLEAFTVFDDIFRDNKQLLTASGFVGCTTWIVLSSCYYLAERHNSDMIWDHPGCTTESGGAGDGGLPPCTNRFHSIASSSYYTLLNLFGEFPLINEHTAWGRVIGCFTAVVAVAVFAIPTGVMGAGFETRIIKRKVRSSSHSSPITCICLLALSLTFTYSLCLALCCPHLTAYCSVDMAKQLEQSARGDAPVGQGPAGHNYQRATCCVLAVHVITLMISTMVNVEFQPQNSEVSTALLAAEVLSIAFLTADYVARLWSDEWLHYVASFFGLVDLAAIAPFYIGLMVFGRVGVTSHAMGLTVLRVVQVMCLLKLERWFKAFATFDDVIRANADVLAVSGFAAVVMWVFASSLMYFAERNNPDPDIAKYYTSAPTAMWLTLLNLTGEFPACDYTLWGKIVTSIVGAFAVAIFAIPVGLLGAGFEEWIETVGAGGETDSELETVMEDGYDSDLVGNPNEGLGVSSHGTAGYKALDNTAPLFKLWQFLEGRTPGGRYFEHFILLLILASVAQAIISTVDAVCPSANDCPRAFDVMELLTVLVFTVELALRIYTAPEDPQRATWAYPRLRYLVSFYCIIDLLAVVPFYLAQFSSVVDKYDNYLRLLRMFRLLKMDKYIPSVSLIDDVFQKQKKGLLVSGYAASVMWACFSALVHLTERDNKTQVDCMTMAERFVSVPSSLQYDLILLTGDYPLVDFTFAGKIVNTAQIIVAVGIVAVPSGLIAGGFTDILASKRKERLARRQAAARVLQAQVRGHLARQRFLTTVQGAMAAQKNRAALIERRKQGLTPLQVRLQKAAYAFVSGGSSAGLWFRRFVGVLIGLNVLAVVLESEPRFGSSDGNDGMQMVFNAFEAVSVVVFTFDYVLRLWSAPQDPRYGNHWTYAASFFGIVDVLSILPWYIQSVMVLYGASFDASVFRVLRLFRLLQLEHFMSAFTLLDDVWREAKDVLAATGLLALIVWITSATLLFLSERGNACTGEAFADIPSAMYYTAIFLGGEWGQLDFSLVGRLVCCVLCCMGIALFAIPVGTVFEAFGEVLTEANSKEEEED